MTVFGKTLPVLFGLVCLGALGVGGYFTLQLLIPLFGSMDVRVSAVTAIASVVVLLAAMIIASSMRQARKQNTANQLHAETTATYQLFLELWMDLLRHGRGTEDHSPHPWSAELLALDCRLMLYGSSSVVKAHAVLRALERDNGAHHPQVRLQVARVLLAIRQDLGLATQGLTAEELLSLLPADSGRTSAPANTNAYRDLTPRVSLASSA